MPCLARTVIGLLAIAIGVTPLLAIEEELPSDIIGVWDTGEGALVEVYECDGKHHGRFIQFYEGPPDGGLDTKNPDPELRNRPLLGIDFILNFEFIDKKWKNGRIYNPENGKLYKADLQLKNDVLKVRGWLGIRLLGRTVEWVRSD